MATAKKTKTLMGPGEMKNLVSITSASVPTMLSKEFAEKLAGDNYLQKLLKKFWKDLCNEDGMFETFIVGEVFQHRNSELIPQWMSEEFNDQLLALDKGLSVEIDTTPRKFNAYVLPKNENDASIQENAKSVPMSRKEYWLIRYLLIINPELGKKVLGYELKKDGTVYLFHVRIDAETVVALGLHWSAYEWFSILYPFGDAYDWHAGFILLSLPATAIAA